MPSNSTKFTTLSTKTIHSNPYWTYKIDRYILPDGKSEAEYYYCDARDSVLVLPIWSDASVSICRQYRYLMNSYVFELCGGAIEEGDSWQETARKELLEELGIEAEDFQLVGSFNPYKGVTNERCWVSLCKAKSSQSQKLEQSEEIQRIDIRAEELEKTLLSCDPADAMSLAALTFLKKHLNLI